MHKAFCADTLVLSFGFLDVERAVSVSQLSLRVSTRTSSLHIGRCCGDVGRHAGRASNVDFHTLQSVHCTSLRKEGCRKAALWRSMQTNVHTRPESRHLAGGWGGFNGCAR